MTTSTSTLFSITSTIPDTTTTNYTAIINIDPRCGKFYNNTGSLLVKDYAGIPENLMLNLAVWFVLIVLFSFLRHIGDYGKFGLLRNDEQRWNSNIFSKLPLNLFRTLSGNTPLGSDTEQTKQKEINDSEPPNLVNKLSKSEDSTDEKSSDDSNLETKKDNQSSTITNNGTSNLSKSTSSDSNNSDTYLTPDGEYSNRSSKAKLEKIENQLFTLEDNPHGNIYKEKHILSWLVNLVKLKDKHINEKNGKDAHYYIVFQRYIIIYLFVITIISLSILLPINMQGSVLYSNEVFGSTTILNVLPDSPVLWVHISLAWVYLVIGLIFMRLFSAEMSYTESDYISRSVLITHYPTNEYSTRKNVDMVYQHFREAYPDLKVTDVQFCYNLGKLVSLEKERQTMNIAKISSELIYHKTKERPLMYPFHFGLVFEACCCCFLERKLVDSIDFYSQKEYELKSKIEKKRAQVLTDPIGVLFITFEKRKMADKFRKDYRWGVLGVLAKNLFPVKKCASCYLCRELPKDSNISNEIKASMWHVRFAKAPSNIKWENISQIGALWWIRAGIINLILFIIMIFFTTPSILIEKLTTSNSLFNVTVIEQYLPSYVAELLPSLILRLLAVLLPVLVSLTSLIEMHWTRSAENRSIMIKVFTFLLFMVLILPTLGLTTLDGFLQFNWLKKNSIDSIKWRCISDNGAFFLKYVTTCSLIGTALDLLRLPDLFLYIISMIWSRSSAERLANRKKAAFEFDYGVQYAWMLTVFTIVLCFSVVCPLITPFGLLYMIMKHIVDRYNIYFAYISTKVDKDIHKSGVTFCIFSFLLLQLFILFFIAIRNESQGISSMTIVQIIVICITFVIYFGRLFFGVFKKFTPFNKKKNEQNGFNYSSNSNLNIEEGDEEEDESGDDNDSGQHNEQSTEASSSNNLDSITNVNDRPKKFVQTSQPSNLPSENFKDSKQYSIAKRDKKTLKVLLESPFIPNILSMPSSELRESSKNKIIIKESKPKLNTSLNKQDQMSVIESAINVNDVNLETDNSNQAQSSDASSPSGGYGTLTTNTVQHRNSEKSQSNEAFQKDEI